MHSYLETSEASFLLRSRPGERGSGLGANAMHVSDGRSATYAPHAAPSPSLPALLLASKAYGGDREASKGCEPSHPPAHGLRQLEGTRFFEVSLPARLGRPAERAQSCHQESRRIVIDEDQVSILIRFYSPRPRALPPTMCSHGPWGRFGLSVLRDDGFGLEGSAL